MDELLKKLFESQVLSPEVQKELQEAFSQKLEEATKNARDQAAADVRAELTAQFVKERDQLVEAVDAKIGDFLAQEMTDLKEDINRFRDLEAEYAEKLVEAKSAMSSELKGDLLQLVEKLDTFLEMRLSAELEELRENVKEVQKNEFGRRVFEAFAQEYMQNYADEDTAQSNLQQAIDRIDDLEKKLELSESKRSQIERSVKMSQVLSPLSGRQKEVMEAILKNVETTKLDEAYKTFIGRVVRESVAGGTSEKESKVLAENAKVTKETREKQFKEKLKESRVATGDDDALLTEQTKPSQEKSDQLAHLRRLAGVQETA